MRKLIILLFLGLVLVAEAKTSTKFKVKINGKDLDQLQYRSLKLDRVNKVKNMKQKPITFEEAKDWVEIANMELKDCPITLKQGEDIIKVINNKLELETGC